MKLFNTLFYALLATSSLSYSAPVRRPSSSDTLTDNVDKLQPSVQLEALSSMAGLAEGMARAITPKLENVAIAATKVDIPGSNGSKP
jgi:hypothetical protein